MTSSSEPLRRPLGLALAGGGALGGWQAAALSALSAAGLSFDEVLGFSAGALNGVSYALGRLDETLERWRATDGGVLRLSPRLFPPSLFSARPLEESLAFAADDARARAALRCPLTIVTARADRSCPVYARFTRESEWDGPLLPQLVASCAIPLIFPRVALTVRGERLTVFDGGVPCRTPMSFSGLKGCRDVVVLEMVREDEPLTGRGIWAIEARSRAAVRGLIDQGAASLEAAGVRVLRLRPSRRLDFSMLSFQGEKIREAMELGAADAKTFLSALTLSGRGRG